MIFSLFHQNFNCFKILLPKNLINAYTVNKSYIAKFGYFDVSKFTKLTQKLEKMSMPMT